MALPPHHHLALHLQQPHHQQLPPPQPFLFGAFNSADASLPSFTEPPLPSFMNVMGISPHGELGGSEVWEEPARKRAREQENSQISALDFLQVGSVSTGLGLSLDDRRLTGSSSVDSPLFFPLFGDDVSKEMQRQEAEMDRFLKVQSERLRQAILEKIQAKQFQSLTAVEERTLRKLREMDAEIESMSRKNLELEEQMKQLSVEVEAWQNHARCNENAIAALRFHLQLALTRGHDSKEGCGDSEVNDTASCCNREIAGLHPLQNEMKGKETITCKVCKVNEVCMLLLPCRHLCLCKECENKLNECPVCLLSKFVGIEIYV